MNVKKLKELLSQYPEDIELVIFVHSDYQFLDDECLSTVNLVDKVFYLIRAHPSMSEENVKKEKQYLKIGN